MWNNGSTAMPTSSWRTSSTGWSWQRLATRLWWVSMTPLGRPGGPLEYGSDGEVALWVDGHLGRLVAGAQQRRERGGADGLAEHEDLPDARPAGRRTRLVQ